MKPFIIAAIMCFSLGIAHAEEQSVDEIMRKVNLAVDMYAKCTAALMGQDDRSAFNVVNDRATNYRKNVAVEVWRRWSYDNHHTFYMEEEARAMFEVHWTEWVNRYIEGLAELAQSKSARDHKILDNTVAECNAFAIDLHEGSK